MAIAALLLSSLLGLFPGTGGSSASIGPVLVSTPIRRALEKSARHVVLASTVGSQVVGFIHVAAEDPAEEVDSTAEDDLEPGVERACLAGAKRASVIAIQWSPVTGGPGGTARSRLLRC